MAKWVYAFGGGKAEGKPGMREPARRQGREPRRDGESRPAGAARLHHHHRGLHPLLRQRAALSGRPRRAGRRPRSRISARITGKKFGDRDNPLLVSVRSGARASMPGMMDTVLNLGLNDDTVEALAKQSGDRRFAYDSYRRFITMYSNVVLGIEHHHFEDILEDHKDRNGYTLDTELAADDWSELVARYKERVEEEHGKPFPQDPQRAVVGRDRRGVRLVDERTAPSPIAACTTSRKAGAPRSTCRPWCSATWATRRRPASPSRAIPRPARSGSTANS